MEKVLIWYLDSDPTGLEEQFEGFKVIKPTNRTEFISELQNLGADDLHLHILTHGNNKIVSPVDDDELQEYLYRENKKEEDIFVQYSEIKFELDRILFNKKLIILNMMGVCYSFKSGLIANYFIGADYKNNDFLESFEIYPFDTLNYKSKIRELNDRRDFDIYKYRELSL